MSIYVRYEYDKMFESTTKHHDVVNGEFVLLLTLKPNIAPNKKNTKEFSKTIDLCLYFIAKIWTWQLLTFMAMN